MTYGQALALIGLQHVTTGGGCSALELRHSDTTYTWILDTALEDQAPTAIDSPVTVCYFDDEANTDEPEVSTFPTLRDAVLDIYGPIAEV